MKVLSIAIVRCDLGASRILCFEFDGSSFSFFERGTAREGLLFVSRTIAERTARGVRLSVEHFENMAHSFCNLAGLAAVIVADQEYPSRVAFALIGRILEDFTREVPRDTWLVATERVSFPRLGEYLQQYQDPASADPIMRVQRELDETKVVLHKTMDSLLQRGERLDDLVARSDELGSQSKQFFKMAKKQNSCCVIQ